MLFNFDFKKVSSCTQTVLRSARDIAAQHKHKTIEIEHLFLALLDNLDEEAKSILSRIGVNFTVLRKQLLDSLKNFPRGTSEKIEQPSLASSISDVFKYAWQYTQEFKDEKLRNKHLLMGILRCKKFYEHMESQKGTDLDTEVEQEEKYKILESYCLDLTNLARMNKLDPVIGRDKEIERVMQVISRRTKNNPVLIGDPGIGKTAIVEALAQKIVSQSAPEKLKGKRILILDLGALVAGTKYRGEFEGRLKEILKEIRSSGDKIIIFIDELHTLVGAGAAEGTLDASNMLKPALAKGELHCIGATTSNEYYKYIEKDKALERRFQPILIDEPGLKETISILKGVRERYEIHHGVNISDSALYASVILSQRYITDRFWPDKAIDLLDESSSKVSLKLKDKIEDKEVTDEDVAEVVAKWTGIPVHRLLEEETKKLLNLEQRLSKQIVGQDRAVRSVSNAIRRARSGLRDPDRPIASFLFIGPAGVGKTKLASVLAEVLFNNREALIKLDMSEYMEGHATNRIIGAPAGYIGYAEGGHLTEIIRRQPYSVILFDEIEKAHHDVINLVQQIIEDGYLTDNQGRKVYFKHTIIIMTSNIGTSYPIKRFSSAEKRERINGLKKKFHDEFLNSINEIIVFNKLKFNHIKQIVEIQFNIVKERLAEKKITINLTGKAKELLAKRSFKSKNAAKTLNSIFQNQVLDPLSFDILAGNLKEDDAVRILTKSSKLVLKKLPQIKD